MKNNIIILSVFILLTIVSNSFGRGSPPPSPKPKPIDTQKAGHLAFDPVRNYTTEERAVLLVAENLANKLLQSKCFEEFMLKRNLIDTNGKSRADVVTHLKHSQLTVPVEMYYSDNSTVGYRQPPAPDIFTNRKYHAGATACSRSSNLTHEWSHSLGYGHASQPWPSRPRSVPYSINAAFLQCCSCEGKSITKCSVK